MNSHWPGPILAIGRTIKRLGLVTLVFSSANVLATDNCERVNPDATPGYDFTAGINRWGSDTEQTLSGLEGKRIRNLVIKPLPIFDTDNPKENNPIYRWANRVHISTKQHVIEDLILFHSGDPVDTRALGESERILRDQGFVADAKVNVTVVCDDAVDLEVLTKEVWSLTPTFSLKSSGGNTTGKVGMRDTNFLGLGKSLSFGYSQNTDRNSYELGYKDPSLFRTRTQFETHLVESDDGYSRTIDLGLPFYSLQSEHSWGLSAADSQEDVGQFRFGSRQSDVTVRHSRAELLFGKSKGLIDGTAQRFSLGLVVDDRQFEQSAKNPFPGPLPDDISLAYPFVQYELIDDDFLVGFNINQISRSEDIATGRHFLTRVGYSPKDEDRMIFSGLYSDTLIAKKKVLLQASLEWQGRWNLNSSKAEDARLDFSMDYYRGQTGNRSLFVGIDTSIADGLSIDHQMVLGGETGLRGYPSRYLTGDTKMLLTIEERLYTDYQPLSLANVGFAAFVNTGTAYFRNSNESRQWYTAVGVGLRLVPSKSDKARVIHFDIAYPINKNAEGAKSVQFIAEVKKSL